MHQRLFGQGSNKLSESERVRILRFFERTSRDFGHIPSIERILIHECFETIPNGEGIYHVAYIFEINHWTGHWKKIKRRSRQQLKKQMPDVSPPRIVCFLRLDENGDEVEVVRHMAERIER